MKKKTPRLANLETGERATTSPRLPAVASSYKSTRNHARLLVKPPPHYVTFSGCQKYIQEATGARKKTTSIAGISSFEFSFAANYDGRCERYESWRYTKKWAFLFHINLFFFFFPSPCAYGVSVMARLVL